MKLSKVVMSYTHEHTYIHPYVYLYIYTCMDIFITAIYIYIYINLIYSDIEKYITSTFINLDIVLWSCLAG